MDETKPQQLQILQVDQKKTRLCDICANGAVLRGHSRNDPAQNHEEVICLFMGRVIEIDVTDCNRFVERIPQTAVGAAAQADTAWVA